MANDKKFIVKNGLRADNIEFTDSQSGSNQITLSMLNTDTLNFEGDAGSLFSIADDLTGSVFTVGDISGIPIIDVNGDTHNVTMAQFDGKVMIGGTDSGSTDSDVLNVTGNVKATAFIGPLTGNATTATTLATARDIGGVSFNGSESINLPGVNTSGNQNTSGTAAIATTVTVADESTDTTCFPLFSTAATGDLAPKSGSNLTFNSSSGLLTATTFSGSAASLSQIPMGEASGTLAAARVGELPASKITSGTFDSARIPILAIGAGNVTSGSFADARIPNLAASKITSGVIDSARIPVTGDITAAKITSGILDSARLPAGTFGGGGGGTADAIAADNIQVGDAAINLTTNTGNITIDAQGNDTDIIFKGTDNNVDRTFLTIDGSEAGKATFLSEIVTTGLQASGDTFIDSAGAFLFDVSDKAFEINSSLYKINLVDNARINFGSSQDGSIQHTGSNLQIFETTGGIQFTNFANDKDVDILTDDGSGGTALYFKADGSTGAAELYHYGTKKLETASGGVSITGTATATTFSGSGASLTNLPAGQLTGTIDSARLPDLATSDITSGTLDSARLPVIAAANLAAKATALATARNIDVTGVTATGVNFDGTGDIDIEVTAVPASLLTGTIDNARISLDAAEIPNLATSKITSGTLDSARVPVMSIGAGNITSGTIASARLSLAASDIPNLAASKITSGTLDSARLPVIASANSANSASSATVSAAVTASTTSTNATHYVTFIDGQTGSQVIENDAGLTYNPSSNTLTTTTFSGALSGNATTATTLATARDIGGVTFNGSESINLPGVNTSGNQNTSGTAAIATSITAVANNSTNETVYLTFVDGATGTQGIETDTGLTYNPSTGLVTATKFSGDGSSLTGIAAGAADGIFLEYQKKIVSSYNVDAGVTALTACNDSDGIEITSGVTVTISDSSGWVITGGDKNMGLDAMVATSNQTERTMRTGTIKPTLNNTYDLGDSAVAWRNIYTNDLNLSNETGGGNDVDGTTGKWTIQEGEENLYIINRKTGKKYKFMLEEIV